MNELKRIDFNSPTFMANGKEYRVENGFSISRYCEYQMLEKELGFNMTFKAMYEHFVNMDQYLNKVQFVEAAVANRNMITGMEKLEEREPTMLKLCCLFINTPDEDRRTINADLITEKINDWKTEGIDVRDFFTLAFSTMDGFIEVYNKLTRTISEVEQVVNEKG